MICGKWYKSGMSNSDVFARPPEKLDRPYSEVVGEPIWVYDGEFTPATWPPLVYVNDEECSQLSGVPERSLLTLQTAKILHATKAPIGGGTHRRVWHLSEAAAAAMIECFRKATNINYPTTAKIVYEASVVTKVAFLSYLNLKKIESLDQFEADIILGHNRNIYLHVSDAVRLGEAAFRKLAIGENNIIPFAGIENGESKLIDPKNSKQRTASLEALTRSRFRTTINLKNVFTEFERQARMLRKT